MEGIGLDFILKLAATAAVVLLATLFVERAGAFLAAVVIALPISAGPAYVIVAIEQDAAFIARSAEASLVLNIFMGPFLIVAATVLRRTGSALLALASAMPVWALGAAAAIGLDLPTLLSITLNAVGFLASAFVVRSMFRAPPSANARRGIGDLLWRLAGVLLVVGLAILAARELGPAYAGVMALFPVVWISTIVMVTGRSGPGAAAAMIANGVVTMNAFWVGLSVAALSVPGLGSTLGLSLALAASVAVGLGLTAMKRHIDRRALA